MCYSVQREFLPEGRTVEPSALKQSTAAEAGFHSHFSSLCIIIATLSSPLLHSQQGAEFRIRIEHLRRAEHGLVYYTIPMTMRGHGSNSSRSPRRGPT